MNTENQEQQDLFNDEPQSIFDIPVPIEDENGDVINVDENNYSYNANDNYSNDESEDEELGSNDSNENIIDPSFSEATNPQDDIDFEDSLTQAHREREERESTGFDEEQAINKLKELGYNIDKKDTSSPDIQDQMKINEIEGYISRGNQFLNLTDEEIVKKKIENIISKKYSDSGRAHLIGTEDFKTDIEIELDEYQSNPKMMSLFADSIRRDVREDLTKSQAEMDSIIQKKNQRQEQELAQNRIKLQEAIKTMTGSSNGFLGVKLSVEDSKEIYKSVTSGAFTKQVNSDPNLVAEFAAYIKFRDKISERLNSPSYGEGVKAAYDKIVGTNNNAKNTPLGTAIQQSSGSQGLSRKRSSWSPQRINLEELGKDQIIAGKPDLF